MYDSFHYWKHTASMFFRWTHYHNLQRRTPHKSSLSITLSFPANHSPGYVESCSYICYGRRRNPAKGRARKQRKERRREEKTLGKSTNPHHLLSAKVIFPRHGDIESIMAKRGWRCNHVSTLKGFFFLLFLCVLFVVFLKRNWREFPNPSLIHSFLHTA